LARAPADDGSAFLLEVDDQYRRDRLAAIGRRWGLWLALALVLLFAIVAAVLFWRERQASQVAALSDRYVAALDKLEAGDAGAEADFRAIAADADAPSYRALALMGQAAAALREGKAEEAARLYAGVAQDEDVAGPLSGYASIKAARLQFADTPPERTIERLRDYAQPGGPWFGPAGEMTALAYLKAGKPAQAAPLFAAIAADPQQLPSLRLRAGEMARSLGATLPKPAQARAGTDKAGGQAGSPAPAQERRTEATAEGGGAKDE
jgi:hypothetical protein